MARRLGGTRPSGNGAKSRRADARREASIAAGIRREGREQGTDWALVAFVVLASLAAIGALVGTAVILWVV